MNKCRITMIPSDCISLVMQRLRSFENTNRSCYCCNMGLYPTQMGLEWFRHYRWTHNSSARMKNPHCSMWSLKKMSLLQVETLRTDEIQLSGPTISFFFVFCRLDQEISQPLILPLLVNPWRYPHFVLVPSSFWFMVSRWALFLSVNPTGLETGRIPQNDSRGFPNDCRCRRLDWSWDSPSFLLYV